MSVGGCDELQNEIPEQNTTLQRRFSCLIRSPWRDHRNFLQIGRLNLAQGIALAATGVKALRLVHSKPYILSTRDAHLITMPQPTRSIGGGGFCDLFLGIHAPTGQRLAMKRPRFSAHIAPEVTERRIFREADA
ncbi:hypothetical protein FRB93_012666 [Tulasnella sp. JGI-2019a]|nr:hypothetical protein FRB93_012666 [Tulasnella sp. JGI-2019a]